MNLVGFYFSFPSARLNTYMIVYGMNFVIKLTDTKLRGLKAKHKRFLN